MIFGDGAFDRGNQIKGDAITLLLRLDFCLGMMKQQG